MAIKSMSPSSCPDFICFGPNKVKTQAVSSKNNFISSIKYRVRRAPFRQNQFHPEIEHGARAVGSRFPQQSSVCSVSTAHTCGLLAAIVARKKLRSWHCTVIFIALLRLKKKHLHFINLNPYSNRSLLLELRRQYRLEIIYSPVLLLLLSQILIGAYFQN